MDSRLKVTAPNDATEEIKYDSSDDLASTVNFASLGLSLDSSDGEETATSLLGSPEDFTVNALLQVTAPDGST